jgi:hypothetical protein
MSLIMITLSLANGLTLMITSSLIHSNSDTINSGSDVDNDVDDGSGDCGTIIVALVMADTACIRVSVCRQLTSFTYDDDDDDDDDDDEYNRSDDTANCLTLCKLTVSKCISNEGTSTTSSLSASLSITR